MQYKTWSSPKVEMQESPIHGRGLFAKEKIYKNELLIDFEHGKGKIVQSEEADRIYNSGNDYMIQIDDNTFFVTTSGDYIENEIHINHSCDPCAGINGSLEIVAMRDIEPGKEATFDYAMSESSRYQIECNCGSQKCRKTITGDDWKNPELQRRYKGYFSDYLQQKISVN